MYNKRYYFDLQNQYSKEENHYNSTKYSERQTLDCITIKLKSNI